MPSTSDEVQLEIVLSHLSKQSIFVCRSGFVRLVTEAVEAMSKDTLAKPSGMAYANVGRHLERLVDKRALRSVEDKLQALLMTDAPQRAT